VPVGQMIDHFDGFESAMDLDFILAANRPGPDSGDAQFDQGVAATKLTSPARAEGHPHDIVVLKDYRSIDCVA